MKILQLHNRYRQSGGEDAVVEAESRLLRSVGHDVVEHHVENPGGRATAAGTLLMSPHNPFSARRLESLLRTNRPDVAHIHNMWYSLTPSVLDVLRRHQAPVVMTLHNYRLVCANGFLFRDGRPCEDCVGTGPWHGVRHRCYRDSALSSAAVAVTIERARRRSLWADDVDVFFALTPFAKGRFVAGGLPEHKIRVKPQFVEDPGRRAKPASASRRLLYVGRLSQEKGVHVLLDAWRRLRNTEFTLVIVGDGPLRPELERRAPSDVRFLGSQPPPEVRRLMLTSRALLFPSIWYEGAPLALIEGMAASLALIASRLGGIPHILGEAAYRLPSAGYPPEWTTALEDVSDDASIDAAADQGRARYEKQFTPARALVELEEGYEAAING